MLQQSPPIRRNHLGELYELAPAQRRKCADLARRECCNYKDGDCLLLENIEGEDSCPCVQTISNHIECRWFQNAMLPIDWKLEAEIFTDDRMSSCKRCGTVYRTTRSTQKYCPDCSQIMRKIKSREYSRTYRLSKKK